MTMASAAIAERAGVELEIEVFGLKKTAPASGKSLAPWGRSDEERAWESAPDAEPPSGLFGEFFASADPIFAIE